MLRPFTLVAAVTSFVALAAAPAASAAVAIDGLVYEDVNGDGAPSAGEPGIGNVAVEWEIGVIVVTDGAGKFTMTAPSSGIVWARTPDGYSPTPSWALVPGSGSKHIDLGLRRSTITAPLSFIHASDTHIGLFPQGDVTSAFQRMASLEPRPAFFVITGDITQDNKIEQFDSLRTALTGLEVPFVPVNGNHDVYDGGVNYRKYMGPPQYSFEQGGVHFLVLDFQRMAGDGPTLAAQMAWIKDDIARSPPGMPAVAFTHMPPWDNIADDLAAQGIDYLFTGHWHSNRLIDRGGMLEVNTEPMLMGGVDFTPAGYRVASFADGKLVLSHFATVDENVLRVIHPRAGSCVPPGPLQVRVAAETGRGQPIVTVELDGGAPVAAAFVGGWSHVAPVTLTRDSKKLTVRSGADRVDVDICVEDAPPAPADLPDWREIGGSSAHHGATDHRLAPPLRTVWAASVGGHVRGGSPVLADGRLFVPVVDLGDSTRGGVVALDARTGARLWEKRSGYAVHNAPAVADGTVVFGTSKGMVYAVDAATGADRWQYDLAAGLPELTSWLYAAPTISDGTVYIGVQHAFGALDLATGRMLWQRDPAPNGFWLGSFSSAGVGGGVVVANFSRGADGMVAWDAIDGHEIWRLKPPYSLAVSTAVLVDGDVAYFANSSTTAFAVDLLTSQIRWQRKIFAKADEWSYGVAASPALAGDKLILPTQYDSLVALDPQTGVIQWEHDTGPASIRPVHYRGAAQHAFPSAPVITGDVVWVGGADGVLLALDVANGKELWSVDLGAPVLSAPVPSGDMLFVATWDGTVQALQHAEPCPSGTCKPPPGEDEGGCRVGRGEGGLAAVLLALLLVRRRRARG